MLNPFPQLLIFSFFVPTLLRLTVTLTLLFAAQHVWRNRRNIESMRLPIVGQVREWMIWLIAAVLIADAFFLFIGLGTQWAAVVGALAALKYALLPARYDAVRPLSRGTAALLFIICVSLLLSGAGAFAFDLPL